MMKHYCSFLTTVLLIYLLEDHAGCVCRIAKFIEVNCDDDTLARVVHTMTHAEMAHHHRKFDTYAIAMYIAKKAGDTLPPESKCVERVHEWWQICMVMDNSFLPKFNSVWTNCG